MWRPSGAEHQLRAVQLSVAVFAAPGYLAKQQSVPRPAHHLPALCPTELIRGRERRHQSEI